ncbi:MAG: hypothetical protein H6853_00590 [Rhodospirillales bacterium]|nr:hypothetical protein [Alphaproteobacteria bacterium]USO03817.1 MAG: hypothetical protein H6853_00590 [Rhodospirillales bacterium]
MRFGFVILSVFCVLASGAQAQERPLYNSSGSSSGSGGRAIYNGSSVSGGGNPLSLNQIVEGRSTTGYEYSYKGTGYNPYGAGSLDSSEITMEDVRKFRAEQAAQYAEQEKAARGSFMSYDSEERKEEEEQEYLNRLQQEEAKTEEAPAQTTKKNLVYKGRPRDIEKPRRIFNSVP